MRFLAQVDEKQLARVRRLGELAEHANEFGVVELMAARGAARVWR